ncbi:hypothetical protein [Roseibacillus persicicus]|uniref:Uncharacterized protein n=1 Tax=Roseibacillus persicicus TaxID=454148 RepID=A0A918U036_9BACT|nr:hypothetical protein [Roseibacillus persicicus]MDQ8192270.1 hypothetical protein [Roseibacillus persicicus]GHC67393.1 hypothetical protein GCM10007100_39290 [Roseibacillus persicicus]
MTFEDYQELMQAVVARQGYAGFHPSLYLVGDEDPFRIHDCPLSEDGEEQISKDFAAGLLEDGQTAYLAYRAGERTVEVCLIEDFQLTDKMRIRVAS